MPKVVTYSPAYTIVPTYECFNRCTYCNFRTESEKSPWIELSVARNKLIELQNQGVCEILILSGEVHPRSPRRHAWFNLIYDLCQLAVSLGFLPHTNVGPLSYAEMSQLKTVNASMGLMLEQLTPKLLQTVHQHAPSKVPALRLQQLKWAGQLQIPFTTGLLLGIGESVEDWRESLKAIANLHQLYGHIQEVILQPHSPGSQQSFTTFTLEPQQLIEAIIIARQILPTEITIQIPPNLVAEPDLLFACLAAGARDLGGIGPKDEVNPDYPHISAQKLADILNLNAWQLVPRLPIYPQYECWLSPSLHKNFSNWQLTIKSKN